MSTRLTNEDYLTYVREHEDDIVRGLSNANPELFSKKLSQMANIPYSVFNALDIENIEPQLLIRYMLRIFCEKLNSNSVTWENFLHVLSSLDGETTKFADKLKNIYMHKAEVSQKGEESLHDVTLSSTDATFLTELLVTASNKWEKIALSLGLKEHEKEGCRTHNDIKMSLYKVINYWLSNHSDTTLKKLIKALCSDFVGETNLSLSIETKGKEAKKLTETPNSSGEASQTPKGLTDFQSGPIITDVSKNLRQVAEGNSTLLFVQASPKETVSYQWKKKDTVLEEGSHFLGVHSDILIVSQACTGVEGEYSCCVKNQEKEVHSENISLAVLYPLGKKKLLDLYFTKREVPNSRDSWPPVVSKEFINLALITSTEDSKHCWDISVRGDQDDIKAEKEKVKYEEIFKEYKSGELIMIEGRPGSGKTTLVHKMIKDWANGKVLVGAKLAFLIILREINNKDIKKLSDLLQQFYFEDEELQAVQKCVFDTNGDKLVFVLDGLDEYNSQDKQNDLIFQLLDKNLLPLAMVVVSSRPSASNSLRKDVLTKRIEIVGFSEKEIMEYIDHFPFYNTSSPSGDIPCSQSIQDSLKRYLHTHPNVMDMCYLPVHSAMICYLYSEKCLSSLSTQTNIYKEFTLSIILRHIRIKYPGMELKSLQDLGGEYQEYFDSICKLAYCMTIRSNQVVTLENLKCFLGRNESFHDSHCLGLIISYNQIKTSGKTQFFSFLHLTLQEFLAAYYISHQTSSKQIKLYKQYSESHHMETVWRFYCGLVSFTSGIKQFKGVFTNDKYLRWHQERNIKLIRYAFESQSQAVCDRITNTLHCEFNFIFEVLTPTDLLALGYVMCHTTLPVNKLKIGKLFCDDNRINILLGKICEKHHHQLKYLVINTPISNDGIEFLIHILTSSKSLIELDIRLINVSDEQGERLADVLLNLNVHASFTLSLSSSPSSIEAFTKRLSRLPQHAYLYFTFEDITKEGVQALARGLKVCSKVRLRALSFVNSGVRDEVKYPVSNKDLSPTSDSDTSDIQATGQSIYAIGSEGAVSLSSSFQYITQLTRLDLSHNNISSEGAVSLSGSMKYLTNIWNLDLSHNNIGSEGAVSLSGSMKYLTNIEHLDLSHNNIGSEGSVSLSGSMKYLTNIRYLDLSHNNIGSEGAVSLSGSMKYLTTMTALDLSHNNIGSDGIRHLAKEISHLTNLSYFYIAYNNIDLEGALLLLTNLKECHNLRLATINTSRQWYKLFSHIAVVYVEDIITPDDDDAINELIAAAQYKKTERRLELGFTSIAIPPGQTWRRLLHYVVH